MYKSLVSIYFFIGFVSDLVLNYLSRQTYAPASIKALKIYFLRSSIKGAVERIIVSAIIAGLTIVAAILLTIFLSYLLFNFAYPLYSTKPQYLSELIKFLLLAFVVGYAMDVFIYKTELFGPTLTPFYKIAGAGFWGAAAYIFSIIIHQCILFLNARGFL